jgi:osmotically-inducible protein OsmY
MEGWSGEDRSGSGAGYGTRGDDWGGSRGGDRERGWRSGSASPDYGSQPDFGRYDRDRSSGYGGSSQRGSYGGGSGGSSGYGYGRNARSGDWGFGGSDRDSWRSSRGGEYSSGGSNRGGSWDGSDYSDDNDRGFLDRAADEVASWFGDEDAERRRRMDARGEHRGRGPRSYRRSDDRIREDVNDRLTDDPHIDASEIDVVVESGEVTLTGTVSERFAKRHAEDLAESVSGVQHVQNNLRVRRDETSSSTSTSSTAAGPVGSSTYGTSTGSGGSVPGAGRTASTSGTSSTGSTTGTSSLGTSEKGRT